jgi:hypothetical protein
VTLYQFLDTINADYKSITRVPLIWTADDVTKEEVKLAGGLPYARVVEFGIEVRQRWQSATMLSRLTQVNLFQEALPDQRGRPRDKMQAVWDQVFNAPDYVDECVYGDEDFVKLQYVSGFPPAHDTSSGGLSASVRFRLWFARRAKA